MSVVYHPRYLKHYQDTHHPESPIRLTAIISKLEEEGIYRDVLTPGAIPEGGT